LFASIDASWSPRSGLIAGLVVQNEGFSAVAERLGIGRLPLDRAREQRGQRRRRRRCSGTRPRAARRSLLPSKGALSPPLSLSHKPNTRARTHQLLSHHLLERGTSRPRRLRTARHQPSLPPRSCPSLSLSPPNAPPHPLTNALCCPPDHFPHARISWDCRCGDRPSALFARLREGEEGLVAFEGGKRREHRPPSPVNSK